MYDTGGGYSDPAPTAAAPTSGGFNASPYITAAGGILSAYGHYRAGRVNLAIARHNAALARIQAAQALEAGRQAENVRDLKSRLAQGEIASNFAGQGVVVGAGTSRAVMDTELALSEMDKLMIGINARRSAFGFQSAAAAQEQRGEFAQKEGDMAAISTLLDTGAQLELQSDRAYYGRGHRN
jgi:hypothetical protein